MRIIEVKPGVNIFIGAQKFADDISVMITETQIDRSVRTVCYLKDEEAKELLEVLKQVFKD